MVGVRVGVRCLDELQNTKIYAGSGKNLRTIDGEELSTQQVSSYRSPGRLDAHHSSTAYTPRGVACSMREAKVHPDRKQVLQQDWQATGSKGDSQGRH